MKKILHTFLAVILMLALPLQGFAAVSVAEKCHHDHEQIASSMDVVVAQIDHQHADTHGRFVAGTHKHFDNVKKTSNKDDSSCRSTCCASCAQAALSENASAYFSRKLLMRIFVADTSPASFTPERLDRPPAGNRPA